MLPQQSYVCCICQQLLNVYVSFIQFSFISTFNYFACLIDCQERPSWQGVPGWEWSMECSSLFPAFSRHGYFKITASSPTEQEQLIKKVFIDRTGVPLMPCTPCIPGAPGGP